MQLCVRFEGGQHNLGADDDNGYIVPMDELRFDERQRFETDRTKL